MAEGGKNICIICLEESCEKKPLIKIESCGNCKKAVSNLIHYLCMARYVCTKHRLLTLEKATATDVVIPCPHCRNPLEEITEEKRNAYALDIRKQNSELVRISYKNGKIILLSAYILDRKEQAYFRILCTFSAGICINFSKKICDISIGYFICCENEEINRNYISDNRFLILQNETQFVCDKNNFAQLPNYFVSDDIPEALLKKYRYFFKIIIHKHQDRRSLFECYCNNIFFNMCKFKQHTYRADIRLIV